MKKALAVTFSVLAAMPLAIALVPAARDDVQWHWVAYRDDPASYRAYLDAWPTGRHASEGRRRYDEHYWAAAAAANTVRAYEQYLRGHADGGHVREAEVKAAALRDDPGPFSAAMKTATEESLRKFLEEFPGHRHDADARQALADITEGHDVVDLLQERKIEIRTEGSGIQRVAVQIRRLVPYPITVRIPVGSYFVSFRRSAQNMVATEERRHRLTTEGWQHVSVPAACANRPRSIPGSGDTFTVQRSPQQQELARLMPFLDKAGASYPVRQAAVWIVTDDASYSDLGILVSRPSSQVYGGTRTIKEVEAARAMKICHEAGLDLTNKRIWSDRQEIAQALTDADLKRWLEERP
jgi:hypothetical protein